MTSGRLLDPSYLAATPQPSDFLSNMHFKMKKLLVASRSSPSQLEASFASEQNQWGGEETLFLTCREKGKIGVVQITVRHFGHELKRK
jgi:hypothetical protein